MRTQTSSEDAPAITFPNLSIRKIHLKDPLVSTAEVKGHLALLHRFSIFKSKIQGTSGTSDRLWKWFIGLAVERFDRWCASLLQEDVLRSLDVILPPVDVIMVGGARITIFHLLSTKILKLFKNKFSYYAEDCFRVPILKPLSQIGKLFSDGLSGELESILGRKPSEARVEFWKEKTSLPFDPIENAKIVKGRDITCPKCRKSIAILFVDSNNSGYLEGQFGIKCSNESCALKITKDNLMLASLVKDICSPALPLAGILREPISSGDVARGVQIKETLRRETRKKHGIDHTATEERLYDVIMEDVSFSTPILHKKLQGSAFSDNQDLVQRIIKSYIDDKRYSVDLYGAVLRQASFIAKMKELHWTENEYFDKNDCLESFQSAIRRYHAFLDLMTASPSSFLVPTLDIDLIWRTHQIMGVKYESDCKEFVGRSINHDENDKIGFSRILFAETARLWKVRFKASYSYCGCITEGNSVGKKFAKFVSSSKSSSKLASGSRQDLIPPNRPDIFSATHASDDTNGSIFPGDQSRHLADQRKIFEEKYPAAKYNMGGDWGGDGGFGI